MGELQHGFVAVLLGELVKRDMAVLQMSPANKATETQAARSAFRGTAQPFDAGCNSSPSTAPRRRSIRYFEKHHALVPVAPVGRGESVVSKAGFSERKQ